MTLLQSAACNVSKWANGSWHSCMFNPATDATGGEPLFGLLVGGVTILGLYVAGDGDVATPSVVTIIFAGLLSNILPAGLVSVAWAVAFVGFAGGLMAIGQRYFLHPGTR